MTKSGKKRKVWVGYGVISLDQILTNKDTGQLAIFSNLDAARYSVPYNEVSGAYIWIGYFIGALNGIAFRQETPPDVKIQALKTIQGYEEWEK